MERSSAYPKFKAACSQLSSFTEYATRLFTAKTSQLEEQPPTQASASEVAAPPTKFQKSLSVHEQGWDQFLSAKSGTAPSWRALLLDKENKDTEEYIKTNRGTVNAALRCARNYQLALEGVSESLASGRLDKRYTDLTRAKRTWFWSRSESKKNH